MNKKTKMMIVEFLGYLISLIISIAGIFVFKDMIFLCCGLVSTTLLIATYVRILENEGC